MGAAPATEQAYLGRAVVGLDLMGLVTQAAALEPAAAGPLYEIWLAAHGNEMAACAAWFNLGVVRMQTANPAGAVEAYRAALRLKPDMAEAAINLGTALEASGQTEAALGAWRAALPPAALRQVLHNQLGRVLENQGKLGPAAEELRASLLISPHQPDVQQHLVHMRQRMTAWPSARLDVPGLTEAEAAANCGPLAALALYDDPALQAATGLDWINRKAPAAGGPLAPANGYAHDRIRIGYLSTDFCRHAMSFLIAELLELHDRDRFEVYGYCASPEDGSDIRARVIAAMDHHIPIKDDDRCRRRRPHPRRRDRHPDRPERPDARGPCRRAALETCAGADHLSGLYRTDPPARTGLYPVRRDHDPARDGCGLSAPAPADRRGAIRPTTAARRTCPRSAAPPRVCPRMPLSIAASRITTRSPKACGADGATFWRRCRDRCCG